MTRAQLSSDYFDGRISQAASAAGEDVMTSFAKLCDPDASLTLKDSLVIHNLFLQRLYMGMKGFAIAQEGGFDTEVLAMSTFVESLGLVVVTQQGRAWLKTIPLRPEQRDALESSPYYKSTCADLGPVTTILEADKLQKANGA